jgi:hypothetical protein
MKVPQGTILSPTLNMFNFRAHIHICFLFKNVPVTNSKRLTKNDWIEKAFTLGRTNRISQQTGFHKQTGLHEERKSHEELSYHAKPS